MLGMRSYCQHRPVVLLESLTFRAKPSCNECTHCSVLFVILSRCFCRFDMFVVGSIFSAVKFWFVGRCQRSSFDQFRCVVLISFRGDILFLRLYHVPLYRLLSKYKILDLFYRLVSPNTSRQLGWLLETEGEDSSFPRSSSLFPIMELEQLRLLT